MFTLCPILPQQIREYFQTVKRAKDATDVPFLGTGVAAEPPALRETVDTYHTDPQQFWENWYGPFGHDFYLDADGNFVGFKVPEYTLDPAPEALGWVTYANFLESPADQGITLLLVLQVLVIVVPLLIMVAYLTLAERKVMASIHRRRGPNVIGFLGLLQPLADGLKLFSKETILPSNANVTLFLFAPMLTFILSLAGWAVIPFGEGLVLVDMPLGLLYLLATSSLGVYGIIISGWASNSKYPFLGALRSAAQMISYEVSLGFIVGAVAALAGSFNLSAIVVAQAPPGVWFAIPLAPAFGMFCISILAETNRHPFDLPEAEAELVSGYNVEYSAMGFALFFLGEYANIILMSSLTVTLFLGGWLPLVPGLEMLPWFGIKVALMLVFFIWMRAALPRYRYDQLMSLGWKDFFPLSVIVFLYAVAARRCLVGFSVA